MNWQIRETPERTKVAPLPKALKIVVQYRTKLGKVYELQSASATVSVCIAYRGEASDPAACRADAQLLAPSAAQRVECSAATPAGALTELSRAWSASVPALPPFDWDAAVRELRAVGAF